MAASPKKPMEPQAHVCRVGVKEEMIPTLMHPDEQTGQIWPVITLLLSPPCLTTEGIVWPNESGINKVVTYNFLQKGFSWSAS